jgi:hypothetical protein
MVKDAEPTPPRTRRSWSWCSPQPGRSCCAQRQEEPGRAWRQARRRRDRHRSAVKELEEALKGEDKDAIDAKTTALMTASQKLGEKMYADTGSRRPKPLPPQRRPRPAGGCR